MLRARPGAPAANEAGRTPLGRMLVAFLVPALAAALIMAQAAGAVTFVGSGGKVRPQPFQGWADDARVPTPRVPVRLRLARCPGAPAMAGCTFTVAPFKIFLVERDRETVLHELGHVFDAALLDDAERARFRSIMRLRARPWATTSTDGPRYRPPGEVFADLYMLCARYARVPRDPFTFYDVVPTQLQFARACRLIRTAAWSS